MTPRHLEQSGAVPLPLPPMRRATRPLLLTPLLLALAACDPSAGQPRPAAARAALTQRQRDSVIGASAIPGARGVAGAIRAADAVDAHTRVADTVGLGQ